MPSKITAADPLNIPPPPTPASERPQADVPGALMYRVRHDGISLPMPVNAKDLTPDEIARLQQRPPLFAGELISADELDLPVRARLLELGAIEPVST